MFIQHIERNDIYDLIVAYYENPSMTKVRNTEGLSMYIVRLPCLLLNEKRYLVALTLQEDAIPFGSRIPLSHLRWKSFMARVLQEEEFETLPTHMYSIKQQESFQLPLSIQTRSPKISVYSVKDRKDLTVSLLHTRGQEFEYPSTGNLVSALETFQTVLHWEDGRLP